jgi:DNA-binding MarR family transcriptional regulator
MLAAEASVGAPWAWSRTRFCSGGTVAKPSRQHDGEGGHLQMRQVADSVVLSQSATTRLVTRLEDRGLLSRYLCPTDRRGIYTDVTDDGLRLLEEARPTHTPRCARPSTRRPPNPYSRPWSMPSGNCKAVSGRYDPPGAADRHGERARSAERRESAGADTQLPPRPDCPGAVATAAESLAVDHLTHAAMVRAHSIDSTCVVSTSRS